MVTAEDAKRAVSARRAYEWVQDTVDGAKRSIVRDFAATPFDVPVALAAWARIRAWDDIETRLMADLEADNDE